MMGEMKPLSNEELDRLDGLLDAQPYNLNAGRCRFGSGWAQQHLLLALIAMARRTPPTTQGGEVLYRSLLDELYAMVNGECPGLLDEDSGGNSKLGLAIEEALAAPPAPASDHVGEGEPIKMVLHCPACGLQHIDAHEHTDPIDSGAASVLWDNPPHRSHLCDRCGHIWRPADVPTEGVAAIQTKGKADSPATPSPDHAALVGEGVVVPRVPTEAMNKAARATVPYDALCEADVEDLWAAMIAAALHPSAEGDKGEC